jgi:hypothetical protein
VRTRAAWISGSLVIVRSHGTPTTDLDAELVLVAVGGLAQGMLSGVYTGERAVELVDHLLDCTVDR